MPEMMAAKAGPRDDGPGHKLYEVARAAPKGTERHELAVAMMHRIYDPIYERSMARNFAGFGQAQVLELVDGSPSELARGARSLGGSLGQAES